MLEGVHCGKGVKEKGKKKVLRREKNNGGEQEKKGEKCFGKLEISSLREKEREKGQQGIKSSGRGRGFLGVEEKEGEELESFS